MILILTDQEDAHADIMVQILNRRGVDVRRLDPGHIPHRLRITSRWDSRKYKSWIRSDTVSVDIDDVTAVWWRRPSPFEPTDPEDRTQQFIKAERDHAVYGMWQAISTFWVNDFQKERTASLKPLQLTEASRLGLPIPKTLITNEPTEVRAFYDECQSQMVYKTMSALDFDYLDRMIYTSPVTKDHLKTLYTVRTTPCLFQQKIPKDFEVRATVVGSTVYSAAIYSQEYLESRDDWRNDPQLRVRVEPYDLPASIEELILRLVSGLGLVYGAVDLIVTPSGDHVFLELNPTGQFGFIEERTGLPLFNAVADLLTSGGHQPPVGQ